MRVKTHFSSGNFLFTMTVTITVYQRTYNLLHTGVCVSVMKPSDRCLEYKGNEIMLMW